ncbi:hypothetical protein SAMN05421640_1679 [Ekhidna lutea]|uniref:Curli production assembly/transport component CsgE n=1 Tax=Ekhidna lutea TaxID=447679 RepID=A0A239IID0_EKHLU|nr:hypothetical protein [Ekhidna lutea]SNS93315.1 hypothetical protein SAMN05421640_1679 [Ekhidna lutea]
MKNLIKIATFLAIIAANGLFAQSANRKMLLLSSDIEKQWYQPISDSIFSKLQGTNLFTEHRRSVVWENISSDDKNKIKSKVGYILKSNIQPRPGSRDLFITFTLEDVGGTPIANERLIKRVINNDAKKLSINEIVTTVSKEILHFQKHGKFKTKLKVSEESTCEFVEAKFLQYLKIYLKSHKEIKKLHELCFDDECISKISVSIFDCQEVDGGLLLTLLIDANDDPKLSDKNITTDYKKGSKLLAEHIFDEIRKL